MQLYYITHFKIAWYIEYSVIITLTRDMQLHVILLLSLILTVLNTVSKVRTCIIGLFTQFTGVKCMGASTKGEGDIFVIVTKKMNLCQVVMWARFQHKLTLNPLTAKLINLNFHPLEVVSRWRDPQPQLSENYSDLTKWRSTLFKSCWLMSHFIFNIFKMWYLMC